MSEFFGENECPICGRKFYYYSADEWAYKKYDKNNHMRYFCSWGCMRKWEKENANNKSKRKKRPSL